MPTDSQGAFCQILAFLYMVNSVFPPKNKETGRQALKKQSTEDKQNLKVLRNRKKSSKNLAKKV